MSPAGPFRIRSQTAPLLKVAAGVEKSDALPVPPTRLSRSETCGRVNSLPARLRDLNCVIKQVVRACYKDKAACICIILSDNSVSNTTSWRCSEETLAIFESLPQRRAFGLCHLVCIWEDQRLGCKSKRRKS